MFSKIMVAIDQLDQGQAALDLVRQLATEGATQVKVLHLRERELSGYAWYSRESGDQASLVAESAIFELRMAGLAAGGGVRSAFCGPGRRGDSPGGQGIRRGPHRLGPAAPRSTGRTPARQRHDAGAAALDLPGDRGATPVTRPPASHPAFLGAWTQFLTGALHSQPRALPCLRWIAGCRQPAIHRKHGSGSGMPGSPGVVPRASRATRSRSGVSARGSGRLSPGLAQL